MDSFPEQREMSKDDYVIILGDFGIWRDSSQQRWYLNWLEEKHFTTLFIDGNHENYDVLDSYPVEEWHGGKVHFIKPSVIHLMRGQVFDIDGLKFFTFGGASSHDISDGVLEIDDPRVKEWRDDPDKMYRINHISWWEREMPNQNEMDEGIKNLAEHNNKVDFILTHCTASSTAALLSHGLYKPDTKCDSTLCNTCNWESNIDELLEIAKSGRFTISTTEEKAIEDIEKFIKNPDCLVVVNNEFVDALKLAVKKLKGEK